MTEFREASRLLTSALAPLETRVLLWIATRLPRWINSDHLTALALGAMFAVGLSYWLARVTKAGLLLAVVGLAINWFGDSLDGTVARIRRRQRPRYGFYVDHIVDAAGTTFLFGGLALSGYMSPVVALMLLVAYLLLLVETFLATYTLDTFTMSYLKIGPTELRVLLAVGTLVLLVHPRADMFGRDFLLLDVAGVVAACAMVTTFVVTTATHVRALYAAEPLS